jgi:transposase
MESANQIIELALGLPGTPWRLVSMSLEKEKRMVTIQLGFERGSKFAHPQTKEMLSVEDTAERSWRHMNFFQYACEVKAPLPRVGKGGEEGPPTRTVEVPWARPGSGFTLFFEAVVVHLLQCGMTVAEAGETVAEYDNRIWRVVEKITDAALAKLDLSKTVTLCIDETSTRKGQNYITVASDPKAVAILNKDGTTRYRARVVAVTEGRDSGSVKQVAQFLGEHGCKPEQISTVVKDMSAAYKKGVEEQFKNAEQVVDVFHVVQLVGEAFDKIRRREHRENPELFKGSMWAWRKREDNLSEEEAAIRSKLLQNRHIKTGRACMINESLREIIRITDPIEFEKNLKEWYLWARRSRLPEMKQAAGTIKAHWPELLAFARTRLSNAPAEALNGLIQTVKRKSRGFKLVSHFKAMIFLLAGNLTFDLPCVFPDPHVNPQ